MIDYININDIELNNIISAFGVQKRVKGYSRNKERMKRKYIDCVCAFDIETTTIDEIEQSIMYIWQLQINDITIIGRTWEEFKNACESMVSNLNDNEYIVIFVHNLSFEFQYLSSVFRDSIQNVFAIDSRKVLKFDILEHIEFRCSYLHSNMSLAEYTRKMKVQDFKLSGDSFNYDKKRYPWEPFESYSEMEQRYIINDVKGLVQAIKKDMEINNDNLYSFVLTSTGLCRRDSKKALTIHKKWIRGILPDLELMLMLNSAFRGGNTHGNRYYAGQIIKGVIFGIDISSSYPTQLFKKYPISKFYPVREKDYPRIFEFIKKNKYAYLMKVYISDLKLINNSWGCPYIPKAKCEYIKGGVFDNGRVLSAEELVINITDIDLKIILEEYDFDIQILKAYRSKYGYLPESFRDLILKYYKDKTELKGDVENEVYYSKAKALLNALYGMCAQNPLKQSIEYINNDFILKEEDPEEILKRYNQTAFLPYQWAVWCTSYARQQLENGMKYVISKGAEFLYTDTDSVKYRGVVDLEELNEPLIKYAEDHNMLACDNKGKIHYLGVWEPEYPEGLKEFIHLGAKKYGYVDNDDKLHITIAGVHKKKGAKELEKMGGLEAFRIGTMFTEAGGNEVIYNDEDYGPYEIEGHKIDIIKNVVIKPSFYTLGITNEYAKLLFECSELYEY